MSESEDTQGNENPEEEVQTPSELDTLKARADQMGLSYHPNIGVDKLKLKIENKLNDTVVKEDDIKEDEPPVPTQPAVAKTPNLIATPQKETIGARNKRLRREAERLIRVRVNCMNPNKKEHEGEMFTVSNAVVGTIRKYVPFNAEDGWHVPNMIYKMMLERQCQIFVTTKGPRGNKVRKGKLIKEFAIEVLEPLSSGEIKKLATRQAMANNIE